MSTVWAPFFSWRRFSLFMRPWYCEVAFGGYVLIGFADLLAGFVGLTKAIFYRARYGQRFQISGLPVFSKGSGIKLRSKGSMSLGFGFRASKDAYFAVIDGGILNVGNRVSVNRNSMVICYDSIFIGDNVRIGPNCVIYDHDHRFDRHGVGDGYKTSPVVIEDNCWIGANVSILRGSFISEGSVVGAGTVVKGFVPPHSIATTRSELCIRPIED